MEDKRSSGGGENGVRAPWSKTARDVGGALRVDPDSGLSPDEARARLDEHGPNALRRERTVTFWGVFKEEVTEPMILLLLVVGVVYAVWGELRDAITIFVVIALLVFAEIFTEFRAKRAVAALRRISPPVAPVVRGGAVLEVPTSEVVPGDLLVLEVGIRVPADARIVEAYGLEADESPLTGESVPAGKDEDVVDPGAPLAERRSMVFAGTVLTRGRGRAVVTATGMDTELGRITGLVLEAKEPKTPLQLAMKQLAGLLVWVAVFFSILIPGIGLLQGKPFKDMVLTGLSLSFATIPEELPIVITMVLGVGALALSKRHVLVRRLRAAETLGGVTAIVTDKTGTLTENRMSLGRLVASGTAGAPGGGGRAGVQTDPGGGESRKEAVAESDDERFLLEIGVLTSNVKTGPSGESLGDPMEIALLEAARRSGVDRRRVSDAYRLTAEFGFDGKRKMVSAVFDREGGGIVLAKGAPEAVLAGSSKAAAGAGAEREMDKETADALRGEVDRMAAEAMRVIALAYKKVPRPSGLSREEAESGLVFAGLAGFFDPVRPGVGEAVKAIGAAGIRTIVVSGDHPSTVKKVAEELGIPNGRDPVTGPELEAMNEADFGKTVDTASLFARTTAEQKLKIVSRLHETGQVVAVTGDGINDAPALKSADIGIAMGETGTEVAREAANMVLTDDSFTSIAAGVREGRKIFDNLTKGITYYLSVKVALVLSFATALVLSMPFPFAPIQIILLELFMDLAASATFVAEPIEPDVMSRRPRDPKGKFVDAVMLRRIAVGSLSLAAAVVFNYLLVYGWGRGAVEAQTVAFATWLIGHIFLALTMRSRRTPLWRLGILSNKTMVAWAGAAIATLAVVTSIPAAREAVKLSALGVRGWLLAAGVPFVSVFWQELPKLRKAPADRR